MWTPISYMPEEFLQLKMGLVLCDFRFLVRFSLARLDEVLIGTETIFCARYSLDLCGVEFVF